MSNITVKVRDKRLEKIEDAVKAITYMKCTLSSCSACEYESFTECNKLCVIDNLIKLSPEEIEKLIVESKRRKKMEDMSW